jgi:hypothetical protein
VRLLPANSLSMPSVLPITPSAVQPNEHSPSVSACSEAKGRRFTPVAQMPEWVCGTLHA